MKVLKFGGSSVGSATGLQNIKQIIVSRNEPTVIVVSALGGITDLLIETARQALLGGGAHEVSLSRIAERHQKLIVEAVPPDKREEASAAIAPLLEELSNIFRGISLVRDLSPKTLDTVVSYGERLSAEIVGRIMPNIARYDSRNFIKTFCRQGRHIVDFDLTNSLIDKAFETLPQTALVTGFIASDRKSGDVTNLGRGGSDYTAAILAAALKAERLEIWTDVDGFMTADPRIIDNAYVIPHLTFAEAMELCNFGAKVVYPPTLYPAYRKSIPIAIRNTFNPSADGTLIDNRRPSPEGKAIKGISSIDNTTLVTVSGLGMVGVIGVNSRIFKSLADSGISVFLVSQAASENNTSIAVRDDAAEQAAEVLNREFAREIALGEMDEAGIERNLATVAVVGENMKHTPGIAGKLFNTLGRNGINVIACAQGASETNISFVIGQQSLRKALGVIHDSFFLSDAQELNLFVVGTGGVGRNLLEQICSQRPNLLADKSLRINVVGIANSRKCLFDPEGIDIGNYAEALESSSLVSDPETICREIIRMNLFNSVFVDCTASSSIAALYRTLLEHNISVVAANKTAASSCYQEYAVLKHTASRRGVKFLFETNVGAGLPIIGTINNLINSGDRILRIEAVVSGTLNYIFNTLSAEIPMSQAIHMAAEAGYSEPDPRMDLNGRDVVRKLVILAREAGYVLEQSDVELKPFIPASFFEGSQEEFWEKIPSLDPYFEELRQKVEASGKRLRFAARLVEGKAEARLCEVDEKHPFYQLEGSNNVILLTTERYKEYPMVIKGYGAGVAVTAAGVFADIIGIANIR